jgi:hypothetical protein
MKQYGWFTHFPCVGPTCREGNVCELAKLGLEPVNHHLLFVLPLSISIRQPCRLHGRASPPRSTISSSSRHLKFLGPIKASWLISLSPLPFSLPRRIPTVSPSTSHPRRHDGTPRHRCSCQRLWVTVQLAPPRHTLHQQVRGSTPCRHHAFLS